MEARIRRIYGYGVTEQPHLIWFMPAPPQWQGPTPKGPRMPLGTSVKGPPEAFVEAQPMRNRGKPSYGDPTAERAMRNVERAPQRVTWQLAIERVRERRARGDYSTLNSPLPAERVRQHASSGRW